MSETNSDKLKNNLKSFALVIAMVAMVGGLFIYEIYFSK